MKVIECLGMARAGKTTQIRDLAASLERAGKSVRVIWDRERAQSLATPPDHAMAYQLTFFGKAIDEYYRALHHGVDYCIIDRGFQDALVWADVLQSLGIFTAQQAEADKTCFAPFSAYVDQTLYFAVPIDVALQRHGDTEHEKVDDVAMNAEWLQALETAYDARLDTFQNLTIIDGSQDVAQIREIIRTNLV